MSRSCKLKKPEKSLTSQLISAAGKPFLCQKGGLVYLDGGVISSNGTSIATGGPSNVGRVVGANEPRIQRLSHPIFQSFSKTLD